MSWRVLRENILIFLSAVPLPEAIVGSFGLKPIALTAALCSLQEANLVIFLKEYTNKRLSLPPVATNYPLGHILRPQIYWLCALYLTTSDVVRISWILTYPSLPPVQIRLEVQPSDPILPKCSPSYSWLSDDFRVSKILTFPSGNPEHILWESFKKATEQI